MVRRSRLSRKGKYLVMRDKKVLAYVKDEAAAFAWLHKHQGQSVHHATTYEGYKIKKVGERK
jgi:hypothetical protein